MDNQIAVFAGVLLSLVLSYTPGLAPKFDALENTHKRLWVLGILFVAAIVLFGAGCAGIDLPGIAVKATCDQAGAVGLINLFVAAVVGNQAAYLIAPKKS